MAGNAVIGALRVTLGLDSAQFETGLKNAQSGLGKFGKNAPVVLAAVAAAGTAAAVAIGIAVKGAINHADALSKTAQKVGVATEALSRLEWAAQLSDVSLEKLSTGLGRLSKSMADVATGSQGPAATAFAALGISVTDAAGKLRNSDEVFADIADRFARMEDGSTKTALAMGLFGKAGAELIPMLNAGKAGLKEMAEESDRLGLTISTKTGIAAEVFNDTLTRVGAILQGVTNRIMQAALPALQDFANFLVDPRVARAAESFATAVVTALNAIVQAAVGVANAISDVVSALNYAALPRAQQAARLSDGDLQKQIDEAKATINNPKAKDFAKERSEAWLQTLLAAQNSRQFQDPVGDGASFGDVLGFVTPDIKPFVADLDTLKTATEAATAAEKALNAAMQEGAAIFASTRSPFEALQTDLDKLGHLLNQRAIDWETYGRAALQAKAGAVAAVAGMASQISGTLAGMFEDNKAFATANAVVSGIEGVAKTLSAYPAPFSFVMAGVQAAAAAAQVSALMSTSKNSTSMPSVGASGGNAAVAPTMPAARSVTINLQGDYYSRESVGSLFQRLNDELGIDGLEIVTTYKQA